MNDHPNRMVRTADRCHCTTPPPRLDPAQEVDAARAALTAAIEAPTGDGSTARIDAATRRYIAAGAAWREAQRAEAERLGPLRLPFAGVLQAVRDPASLLAPPHVALGLTSTDRSRD